MEKGYYQQQRRQQSRLLLLSQSTIKMEKGYYANSLFAPCTIISSQSTIKMEKGYYQLQVICRWQPNPVAIHNKNGKGLLQLPPQIIASPASQSQSTIKMEKGYYNNCDKSQLFILHSSQSTIKMEKGYYTKRCFADLAK